ncbi:MAG: hypothetical protein ACI88A_004604 [Paraglaciecola sp.]|jgi:uncharacterized protein YdbL (DUF1318 family)
MKTSNRKQFKNSKVVIFFTAFALLFSSLAFALTLDEAKEHGLVGEQTNGYLGAVVQQSDVQSLIAEINAKRKSKYTELAERNNISLQDVEKLAAKKAFERTDTGHFLLVNGAWVKK